MFNINKPPKKNPYKVKELKVYGSLESLYQGGRKYRRVFDESETTYVNIEFSFYNILFDEEDWETEVSLKAIEHHSQRVICNIEKKFMVKQEQNIVYMHEGWGTPEPGFWKKGVYRWEAYIKEDKVGETFFYITNTGIVSQSNNPYFDIEEIKLFEGPYEGVKEIDRKYLSTFNSKTARYVNIEMKLKNKIAEISHFPLEMQFYVYNDARQLKAYMTVFRNVPQRQQVIKFDTGYGTRNPGFWYKDHYTIEVIFMDQLIAVIPFVVGDEEVNFSGNYDASYAVGLGIQEQAPVEAPTLTFETAFAELKELIGLERVKKQISDLSKYLQFIQLRQKLGAKENEKYNLHTVFMGNPGTGKTTVARMLGKIYKSLGVLSDGKVHELGRADLVGEFIGQTAPKVKKAINQARGGILFIDEAYSLTERGTDGKDYGREVIEVLIQEMSSGKGDIAIVCAGYTREMESFLNSNAGLRSRFNTVINFDDYTPDELMEIALYAADKKDVILEQPAIDLIKKKVVEAYRNRTRYFGNARLVNGIIEQAKRNMGLRVMDHPNPDSLTIEDISTITYKDVASIFETSSTKNTQLPIDEEQLQEAMVELHGLIGLSSVKREVNEIVKLVRYYRDIGRSLKDSFSIHTVFTGNPGTGKTTVARILVRIYKALGILSRGHLVECDRKSLVAGFVGQTAIKTGAVIDTAIGGGLFIDEAYSLTASGGNDFGREAIEVLLKAMEDKRGQFMVIVAGYPKEMREFMESNPGLKSRFDKYIVFEDYSAKELMEIVDLLIEREGLTMNTAARAYLQRYIERMLLNKNKYFGNARAIRKIVDETIRQHHLRLADIEAGQRNDEQLKTIVPADLEHLARKINMKVGGSVGFGRRG